MKVSSPRGGNPNYFKEKSTWLKYERSGENLTASLSHDGKEWELVKTIPVTIPSAAKLGVLAINSSDKPFTAEFSEFKVKINKEK